jgi:uncharacterized BrkB/YihY/UPF0761 family membrane protein
MKLTSITARIASVAALLAAWPTLAQAHPGHFDWSSSLPQAGHVNGTVALSVLALLTLATAIYRLAPRKR